MQDVLRELIKDDIEKEINNAVKAERAAAQKATQAAAKKLFATGVSSEVIASALNCKLSTVQKWVGAT